MHIGTCFLFRLVFAALFVLPSMRAQAQTFPSRVVKLVVPFAAGGSTDISARLLAAKLSEMWKVGVIVENMGGGDTVIGTQNVIHARPDGYTVLVATSSLPIIQAMRRKVGFDAVTDLVPVTLLTRIPAVLVVNPSVKADTIADFVALARSKPGALNYASPGQSTGQRLTFELLKQRLQLDIVAIPYKSGAPATQAVAAGEVESMILSVLEGLPLIQAGRLRALAVTTRDRVAALPAVPTLAETVLPGLDITVWQGLFVPVGTPPEIVARLNTDVRAAIMAPEVGTRLDAMGLVVSTGSPADFARFLQSEIATWRDVITRGNLAEN